MEKLPISLCIITLNEEHNLDRCLGSVPFVSDIVVLDSGSKDQTKMLALNRGARVFEEPWQGFGLQKRRAVELAANDWVLCLDADEEVTPELAHEIVQLFKSPPHVLNRASGFKMPRRSFHMGRWLYHGGWYPDEQTRLFHRQKLNWSPDKVHEAVVGEGVQRLKGRLNHYPFESLSDQVQTNNKYSTLGAQTLLDKGKQIYFWQLVIKPWIKFVELYLVKKGFLDGIPGFIIAIGGAYSYFLKYAKAWEKQQVHSQKV